MATHYFESLHSRKEFAHHLRVSGKIVILKPIKDSEGRWVLYSYNKTK